MSMHNHKKAEKIYFFLAFFIDKSPISYYNKKYDIGLEREMMKNDNEIKLKEFNDIYRQISDIYHDIANKLGLSDSAFTVFYTIYEMGGSCLQKDICELFYMSKQTVHSCIKKLEKQEYIFIKQGRDKHIYLTDKGQQFVNQNIATVIEIEKSIFSEMTEQQGDMLLELTKEYCNCFKQKIKNMYFEDTM